MSYQLMPAPKSHSPPILLHLLPRWLWVCLSLLCVCDPPCRCPLPAPALQASSRPPFTMAMSRSLFRAATSLRSSAGTCTVCLGGVTSRVHAVVRGSLVATLRVVAGGADLADAPAWICESACVLLVMVPVQL